MDAANQTKLPNHLKATINVETGKSRGMHLRFIVRGGWLSDEYWWSFTLGRVGGAAAQVGRGASGCGHRCSGKCWARMMVEVGEGGVAADTDHCV